MIDLFFKLMGILLPFIAVWFLLGLKAKLTGYAPTITGGIKFIEDKLTTWWGVGQPSPVSSSYGYGVWLVMQRPDSAFFANGAKDNFHITISLGNLSKEAKVMLYSGEDLPKDHIYQTGEGIAWIDGQGLLQINIPGSGTCGSWKQRFWTACDGERSEQEARQDRIPLLDIIAYF